MKNPADHRARVIGSPWPGVYFTCIESSRHFARHWHATYGFGLLEHGAQHSASGRGPVEAHAGDLITHNPGEVHDGRPLGGPSRRWRMVHIDPAALLSLAFALSSGDLARTPMTVPFWLNMLYISIGVTTVATTIFFVTTSRLGARESSSFMFTVPVSAVVFSWLILGEVPSLFTILGGSLAVGAVYLLNRKEKVILPVD